MAAILLTWNPRKYTEDRFRDYLAGNATGWTVGHTNQISRGDTVYLMRMGEDRPGIVGSGIVTETVSMVQNWEGTGSRPGISVAWEHLFDPDKIPPLPRESLPTVEGVRPVWHSQMSGVRIPADWAPVVAQLWQDHLAEHGLNHTPPL